MCLHARREGEAVLLCFCACLSCCTTTGKGRQKRPCFLMEWGLVRKAVWTSCVAGGRLQASMMRMHACMGTRVFVDALRGMLVADAHGWVIRCECRECVGDVWKRASPEVQPKLCALRA